MNSNYYSIKKLCEELNEPRQKVRRRIIKLGIKAVNEDTRTYENEPLEYDYQALFDLAEEFNVKINKEDQTKSEQQRTAGKQQRTAGEQQRTAKNDDKYKLIEVLEEQLKETNKSKANLEKLLDQQQQLTLISNKENELLKLEIEDVKESEKHQKKSKQWWQFWKQNS